MSCIKSIQRGTGNTSTTSFTINEVDPDKCVVIINPITSTDQIINQSWGPWGNTYSGATVASITDTELSFSNVKNTFGWQLIEFA